MFKPLQINGGRVAGELATGRVRLVLPPTSARVYADAQLDDYHALRRFQFPNQPPRHLSLRARVSHSAPSGTFGFGFWNDPFSINGGVLAAPNNLWFFYASPPSDMALVEDVPGQGWKAATLNAGRYPTLLLAPAALGALALTRLPGLGRPVMNLARQMVQAREKLISTSLMDWHHYEIDWLSNGVSFRIDGAECFRSDAPPRGPLGLVIWMDNQYAIASRAGRFGFGLCEVTEEQWLEVEEVISSQ